MERHMLGGIVRTLLIAGALVMATTVACDDDNDSDPTGPFAENGFTNIDVPNSTASAFLDLVRQADGKLIAGGSATVSGNTNILVARFNADGTIDTSFGSDGYVTADLSGTVDTNVTNGSDIVTSLALQPDGKLLVGGYLTNQAGERDMFVSRHMGDGSFDTTFDPLSTGMSPGYFSADVSGIAIAGSLTPGAAGANSDDQMRSIAIVDEGMSGTFIYLSIEAEVSGTDRDIVITKHALADAAFVSGWGNVDIDASRIGVSAFSVPNAELFPRDLVVVADGSTVYAVVGGYWTGTGATGEDHFLLAYSPTDGSLATGFGTGGITTSNVGTEDDALLALAVQTVGSTTYIVGTGYIHQGGTGLDDSDVLLVRFSAAGALDTTFNMSNGIASYDNAGSSGNRFDEGTGIAVDGSTIYVGAVGDTSATGTNFDFQLVLFTQDGVLDTSFDTDGAAQVDIDGGNDFNEGFLFDGTNGYHVGIGVQGGTASGTIVRAP